MAFVATAQMSFVGLVGICCHNKLPTKQIKIHIRMLFHPYARLLKIVEAAIAKSGYEGCNHLISVIMPTVRINMLDMFSSATF
jgi:hypothetical protein